MSQGKKIPAKPLWTKKIACTIGQQEKKFLRWPILPTPPSKIKWSTPNEKIMLSFGAFNTTFLASRQYSHELELPHKESQKLLVMN